MGSRGALGAIRRFRRRPLALRGRGDGVEVDLRPRLGVEERLQPIDGAVEAAAAGGDHQVDRGVGLAVAEVPDPARRGMQVGAALLERPPARRRPPGRHRLPRPGTPLACLRQPQRREPAVQRRERAVVHRAEPGLLQVVRAGRGGLAERRRRGPGRSGSRGSGPACRARRRGGRPDRPAARGDRRAACPRGCPGSASGRAGRCRGGSSAARPTGCRAGAARPAAASFACRPRRSM